MTLLPAKHTFVVCAYQESPYLEACVASVVNQSVGSNVLISTSTPNGHISAIAEKYGLPVFVNNTGHDDMQGNWNFGVSCARTEYVTVCHQDDYYKPDYFERVSELFSEDVLMLHTDYHDVLEGHEHRTVNNRVRCLLNLPMRSKKLQRVRFFKKLALRFGNSVCCPSVTYHVSELRQPIFVSKFKNGCDWDLYITLAETKGAMVYVPRQLCCKRVHPGSATSADIHSGLRAEEDRVLFRRLWPKPLAELLLFLYKRIYRFSA